MTKPHAARILRQQLQAGDDAFRAALFTIGLVGAVVGGAIAMNCAASALSRWL